MERVPNSQEAILTDVEINQVSKTRPASKKCVLLVEDEPIIQKVHGHYLKDMGYLVDIANSGKQALELYQPGKYSVAILDGGLPDTTGFELAKSIRATEVLGQRQYLILLSISDYADVKKKCMEFDIDDFAIKPVKFETLKIMIARGK